jgi:hypothetical protein
VAINQYPLLRFLAARQLRDSARSIEQLIKSAGKRQAYCGARAVKD